MLQELWCSVYEPHLSDVHGNVLVRVWNSR